MSTVILGSRGQLGSELAQLLPEANALSRLELDITSPEMISAVLNPLKPTCVINCTAYNQVDLAEKEPEAAWQSNALGPRNLAQYCANHKSRLIHISTDFVYGIKRKPARPLTEQDLPDPRSVYGVSKLAGEYFVQTECSQSLIIRTCGLYGRGGNGNFVKTMLRLAREGKPLRVVDDQFCAPTSVKDLASAVLKLQTIHATGLFHFVNRGQVSWYEFTKMIFALTELDVEITPISSAEYGAIAKRPQYSVLDCSKYCEETNSRIRTIKDALKEYLRSEMV
ncbi:dTDP-4-dehydrorhamnose reductase [Rubinisphaera sp.]|uniref:dTDP-4-dehydrorhamnose reductase n=1 Tax=Rubinisphaera sp. TaxID=2024857 RepID=UPI000C0D96C1|nr:dTDP-4-dehydrorhamnose reductase [Rubinisphaera sp.]MBV08584.1 dTDP-4-dehydrorhamnose reductase [Rubinisphaera sp.]HCS53030.1 dTDP-4-dehydrorhamnose reductase [Planctomycetaceae bacterium]|tara:strand:- start:34 stop:876 length:843 start_codon:yes stop_codon:yes gene_type:complete